MRREVPLLLVAFFGTFYVLDLFVAAESWGKHWKTVGAELQVWANVVIAFAYVLGAGNVLRIHGKRFVRLQKDWGYSLITVVSMIVMIVFGVTQGPQGDRPGWFRGAGHTEGSIFHWLYDAMYSPMQATMFALLAFYIASAAFRAFRVRTLQSSLLAITAMIVMLGSVPLGALMWDQIPVITDWVMGDLQTAGKRAILIGAALGAISTGLKMIAGLERTFLSGE
jgi:hypothetical protein